MSRNPTCEHCGQDVPFEDFDYLAENDIYQDSGVYIVHAHCISRIEAKRIIWHEQYHGLVLIETIGYSDEN